jgi:hypothetical protein
LSQAEGEHAANVPQQNADDAGRPLHDCPFELFPLASQLGNLIFLCTVLACAAYFHNLCLHHTDVTKATSIPQAILVTEDVGLKLKVSFTFLQSSKLGSSFNIRTDFIQNLIIFACCDLFQTTRVAYTCFLTSFDSFHMPFPIDLFELIYFFVRRPC